MSKFLYFFCTHCRARNRWPADSLGKTLTCPACQKGFVDDDPYFWEEEASADDSAGTPRTAAENSQHEPAPVAARDEFVRPVAGRRDRKTRHRSTAMRGSGEGGQADAPGFSITLTPALQDLFDAAELRGLQPPQRALYCLLLNTFPPGQVGWRKWLEQFVSAIICFVLFGLIVFPSVLLIRFLLFVPALLIGAWVNSLIYGVPLLVLMIAVILVSILETSCISLAFDSHGRATRISLGQLAMILDHITVPAIAAIFIGLCFWGQFSMLVLAPDQGGLGQAPGGWESLLIALDTFCRGFSLGVVDLFELRLTDDLEHTWKSRIWFFLFRLAYAALALCLLVQVWRRLAVRPFLARYPDSLHPGRKPVSAAHVDELRGWLETLTRQPPPWPARCPEVLIFLALAAEQLRGNHAAVREFSQRVPWVAITAEVRQLFVDETGACLLAGNAKE
jgi:hypothetical protein